MQFELLRLSLLERPQLDAFEERDPAGRPLSRERWLRNVFSTRIDFSHRKQPFYYVPQQPTPDAPIIVGRIGRQISVQENEPPDAGLRDTMRETWQAAYLFLDPRHHEDGQKAGLSHNPDVGLPIPLFESLADQINRRDPPPPFLLEVSPLSDAGDFWQFVHENRGEIISVTFELIVPNMFNTVDDYDEELRDMREKEKARKVRLQLENRDGLELETERIKNAVKYASRGGGSVKARTKQNRRFNSKAKARRITVSELDIRSPADLLRVVTSLIFRS